jgi:hypothetical protein
MQGTAPLDIRNETECSAKLCSFKVKDGITTKYGQQRIKCFIWGGHPNRKSHPATAKCPLHCKGRSPITGEIILDSFSAKLPANTGEIILDSFSAKLPVNMAVY